MLISQQPSIILVLQQVIVLQGRRPIIRIDLSSLVVKSSLLSLLRLRLVAQTLQASSSNSLSTRVCIRYTKSRSSIRSSTLRSGIVVNRLSIRAYSMSILTVQIECLLLALVIKNADTSSLLRLQAFIVLLYSLLSQYKMYTTTSTRLGIGYSLIFLVAQLRKEFGSITIRYIFCQ